LTALSALLLWVAVELALLPYGDIVELRTKNPSETAFMRRDRERMEDEGKRFVKRQRWVSLKSISPHLVHAVIVAEDGSFWSHSGFDWFEFQESVERNLREGRFARGASTITQQLVKNLYLSPSKNPLRKLKEWVLTWRMEQVLSKSRILEVYLNVIEWGEGVYGAEAAAQYYFGTSASSLSREQSARLAAVIPNPRRYRADAETRYIVRRSNLILKRMSARGW
jgi:monofunctional biosynthetic peptidoglycan transglycosylase